MTRPAKLSTDEVTEMMSSLHSDWQLLSGRLRRELTFSDFIEAFSFMSAVALSAEAADHHPNWSNVYNSVEIDLFTHDMDGLTTLDFALAKKIDQAASKAR